MQSIGLAESYIEEFDSPLNPNSGLGQLHRVLNDQNSLRARSRVRGPSRTCALRPLQLDEQLHGGTTPYIGWNEAASTPDPVE